VGPALAPSFAFALVRAVAEPSVHEMQRGSLRIWPGSDRAGLTLRVCPEHDLSCDGPTRQGRE